MELEVSSPISSSAVDLEERNKQTYKDQVRVRRKTLVAVLEQCQRALELLNNTNSVEDDDEGDTSGAESREVELSPSRDCSSTSFGDREADELCDLIKSRVECPKFLEKLELECAQLPGSQNITEDGSSWDMVSGDDLWEGENDGSDQEDYVLVQQEDIVEGIACFMAAYLLSLKQTKDLPLHNSRKPLARHSQSKRKQESFGRPGMEAKSFIMQPLGEQLPLGCIKTLCSSGPPLKPSGLHVMLYPSFSEVLVTCWDPLLYLCVCCVCRLVFQLYAILFKPQIN